MYTIVLFGETKKGEYKTGYYCKNVVQLCDRLGEPASLEAEGLQLAVQALLYQFPVIFFRVEEEGFSKQDYLCGLQTLRKNEDLPKITALCLPGVGDAEIIDATAPICMKHNSLLLFSQRDFYDYLMSR